MGKVFSIAGITLLAVSLSLGQVFADPNPAPTVTVQSADPSAQFGYSTSAGDLNNDGYDDLIIGAPEYFSEETNWGVGKISVYYGAQGVGIDPDDPGMKWSLTGNLLGESDIYNTYNMRFGKKVIYAGDLNGDGKGDMAVAAPFWGGFGGTKGKVWVFYGSANTGEAPLPAWSVSSNVGVAFLGSAMAYGDVNHDGIDDLLISSRYAKGRIYVFFGDPDGLPNSPATNELSHQPSQKIEASQYFYNISSMDTGDFNGDGIADLVVGNEKYSSGGYSENGKVWIFNGSYPDGLQTPQSWTNTSNESHSGYGISVTSAGDIDCDGIDEVIVGAYLHDVEDEGNTIINAGCAFVYKIPYIEPMGQLTRYSEFANYGMSVSSAGKWTNDDCYEIMIGDPVYNGSTLNPNRVDIWTYDSGFTLVEPSYENAYGTYFGFSLGYADFNGDEKPDIFIGAMGVDSWNGATYLYNSTVQ